MEHYDLKISNGKVYTPAGVADLDVLIKGEKIALLAEHHTPLMASREIDATGKLVFPGIIDMHVHVREPGLTHKEDFLTASQAGAAGGVTTMIDMPNVEPPTTTVKLFEEKKRLAQQKSIIDFGHFVSGVDPKEIPKLAEAGVTGFKIFQISGAYPHDPRLAENDPAKLLQSFTAVRKTGLICVVHPFNQSLFDYFSEKAFGEGKPRNIVTFSELYTRDILWSSAVALLICLQRESGVRLHVVHTHAANSLKLLKFAKSQGQRITVEIDPKYYHLTHEDLRTKGPIALPGGYITEDEERMRTIWESFSDGTIDVISSEHAPHTMEELAVGNTDAWASALGNPHLEHFFSILITDCHKGKMRMDTLVRVLSENPAKILGIYPQKGVLLPGSDADIVIVDWNQERMIDNKGLYTKVGQSPWAGWKVKGVPVATIARGRVVAENGKVAGKPGTGRYVSAKPNPEYF